MSKLLLQQLFGANAYQNSNSLVITKSNFPNLVATANNTAESLFVAIILDALDTYKGVVCDENNNPIVSDLDVPITYDNSKLYDLLQITYWKRQFLDAKAIDTFIVEHNEVP